MRFLVVGLGSMGKRRIRCLKTLGYSEIAGFDTRLDRMNETKEKYQVPVYQDFLDALQSFEPTALIISVPPDKHHIYMKKAIELGIHFFVEASVVDTDMKECIESVREKNIVAAPSSTLYFHPAIVKIEQILKTNLLGKISNVILHSGQFLPDWHTYESVSEYYVSNPATGGCREIVPFELTWLTKLIGFPKRVCANVGKTIEIQGAEIEDTYNILLDYGSFFANMTIDVVSRYATRRLLINGSKKQLIWEWDTHSIRIYHPEDNNWEIVEYQNGEAESGYNANIGEGMYVEEIKKFIEAIQGKISFVNTLEDDYNVLQLLYSIEESNKRSEYVRII